MFYHAVYHNNRTKRGISINAVCGIYGDPEIIDLHRDDEINLSTSLCKAIEKHLSERSQCKLYNR